MELVSLECELCLFCCFLSFFVVLRSFLDHLQLFLKVLFFSVFIMACFGGSSWRILITTRVLSEQVVFNNYFSCWYYKTSTSWECNSSNTHGQIVEATTPLSVKVFLGHLVMVKRYFFPDQKNLKLHYKFSSNYSKYYMHTDFCF